MVEAEGVTAAPPPIGAAADWTWFFQKVQVAESMPPTVPAPVSETRAWRPLIWLARVPSE